MGWKDGSIEFFLLIKPWIFVLMESKKRFSLDLVTPKTGFGAVHFQQIVLLFDIS